MNDNYDKYDKENDDYQDNYGENDHVRGYDDHKHELHNHDHDDTDIDPVHVDHNNDDHIYGFYDYSNNGKDDHVN